MRRLRTRAQFQALLATRPVARTRHFALHSLPLAPVPAGAPFGDAGPWLGAMVPKRWARRAVRRNAIRRQIYAVGEQALAGVPGAYLVRLRAAFPREQYPSASSAALKRVVRSELQDLLRGRPA